MQAIKFVLFAFLLGVAFTQECGPAVSDTSGWLSKEVYPPYQWYCYWYLYNPGDTELNVRVYPFAPSTGFAVLDDRQTILVNWFGSESTEFKINTTSSYVQVTFNGIPESNSTFNVWYQWGQAPDDVSSSSDSDSDSGSDSGSSQNSSSHPNNGIVAFLVVVAFLLGCIGGLVLGICIFTRSRARMQKARPSVNNDGPIAYHQMYPMVPPQVFCAVAPHEDN